MSVDVSRIVPHLIRDNDLVLLSFPQGFIPIRALRTEFFNFLYDPIAEGMIPGPVEASTSPDYATSIGFVDVSNIKSRLIPAQPINVFEIDKASELIQFFFGVAPSYARVFIAIPSTSKQKSLPRAMWSKSYGTLGFVDGFTSPLLYPAPESETILVYRLDIAMGFGNILYEPIRPLLWFYVNRVKFGIVRDPELAANMVMHPEKTKIKTVGGFTDFDYDFKANLGVLPIPPGASKEHISSVLRG
jgi:hypothetical protein